MELFFLEVCLHLIANFICQDTIKSFSIELKETIMHRYSEKGVSEILEELMLYFISTRPWVENLRIKNCIKNLMRIMLSYFYKVIKYKT